MSDKEIQGQGRSKIAAAFPVMARFTFAADNLTDTGGVRDTPHRASAHGRLLGG